MTQEINRCGVSKLVNINDDSKVDGGVYLYRTENEITEEGVVRVDDATTFQMEFTEYDDFMAYSNANPIDYDKAKRMFTVDMETKEILFYKVDQVTDYYGGDSSSQSVTPPNPTTVLTLQRQNYRSLIEKYAMPFEFLVNLCMITQNPEFVYHVAYLARQTRIELVILDSLQEIEEIEEVRGDDTLTLGSNTLYQANDLLLERYYYKSLTDTPILTVGTVNTWSYAEAHKYTNKIIKNTEVGAPVPLPDRHYTQTVDVSQYYETGATAEAEGTISNIKKTKTTTISSNEYGHAIALNETKKSKQFLGLLRNSTGTCCDENDVENCVKQAVFDRNGINVSYKIPNTTKKEMPINKLQSGEEMLYSLLQLSGRNEQSINTYNAKMQGLKEYMQYIMTFPENEWIDLNNSDIRDLLKSDIYDNVTYGMFWWPLDPNAEVRISSFFGPRRAPIEGASTNHGAIDIAVATGTDVLASADGVVEYVGNDPDGYGNYITIDHQNGYKTRYAHNSQILVHKGDTVTKGQVIAKSGSTGNSTGPHLHFEIHLNGTKVDPLDYVSISNKQPIAETYDIGNTTQLDVIYAVVAQECASSYEGALAVITCVLNRCESPAWQSYGGNDPYKQITHSGQFAYSESVDPSQHYKQYLGGKVPDYVKQAVDDAINKGIRNHAYTRFRTASDEIKKKYPNGQNIGGNWYF